MSAENVALLRRLNALFNVGSPEWLDLYAEDVVFRMPPEWPEEAEYVGREAMAGLVALWRENFDDYRWDMVELVELPGERVLGLFHHRGRIPGEGNWIEQPVGSLFTFREGKVAEASSWFSWEEARAAAGLDDFDLP